MKSEVDDDDDMNRWLGWKRSLTSCPEIISLSALFQKESLMIKNSCLRDPDPIEPIWKEKWGREVGKRIKKVPLQYELFIATSLLTHEQFHWIPLSLHTFSNSSAALDVHRLVLFFTVTSPFYSTFTLLKESLSFCSTPIHWQSLRNHTLLCYSRFDKNPTTWPPLRKREPIVIADTFDCHFPNFHPLDCLWPPVWKRFLLHVLSRCSNSCPRSCTQFLLWPLTLSAWNSVFMAVAGKRGSKKVMNLNEKRKGYIIVIANPSTKKEGIEFTCHWVIN